MVEEKRDPPGEGKDVRFFALFQTTERKIVNAARRRRGREERMQDPKREAREAEPSD
jgi:hypothetical protein